MELFTNKPSIELQQGIKVTKETELEFKNDNVVQEIKDLVLHSITKVVGDGYESTYDTTIQLNDGQVVLFEEDGRGYIVPVEEFVTLEEAIDILKCIE